MAFSDDADTALDYWFSTDAGAVSVTYAGASVYAHVAYGPGQDGGKGATLEVRVSDVATPAYRDTVVIDSVSWEVARPDGQAAYEGDGYSWKLPLVRDRRPARGKLAFNERGRMR